MVFKTVGWKSITVGIGKEKDEKGKSEINISGLNIRNDSKLPIRLDRILFVTTNGDEVLRGDINIDTDVLVQKEGDYTTLPIKIKEKVDNLGITDEKIIVSICVFAEKPVTDEYYAILVKDVEGLIKV